MIRYIAILFSLFFVSQAFAIKTLLIIGDSLTEGYGVAQAAAFPAVLNERLQKEKKDWVVKPAGSSGSTSASGPERIKWLAKTKPDLVLLLLGSNDGLRGLKPEQMEKNLNSTIQWARDQKIEIILGQLYVPPNYGKEYAQKFSQVFKRVADKHKIPLAGFLLENVAGKSDLNLADGIHPNEKGHKVVADNVYHSIIKYLK